MSSTGHWDRVVDGEVKSKVFHVAGIVLELQLREVGQLNDLKPRFERVHARDDSPGLDTIPRQDP